MTPQPSVRQSQDEAAQTARPSLTPQERIRALELERADDPRLTMLVMLDEPQRVAASSNQATAGTNAVPTASKIIERIGPILEVAPRREDDQRKFDAKVLASY